MLAGGGMPRGIANAPAAAQALGDGHTVRIGVTRNGTVESTVVPLETYIARVLAGEALPGSPPAALEALAIAVRTYTIANLGRHKGAGFDLCDTTHCQVMRTANEATERAAQATAGKILLYRGAPAVIYYSAACGGHTEVPSAVWPDSVDPPYLPSQPDDACGPMPWSSELAFGDLARSFAAANYRGTLRGMSIASRNGSGRVARLNLDGLTPNQISANELRAVIGATLGWQHIKSAAFEMRRVSTGYHFDGRGSGHGVGMCVIGSARLAERGATAEAILGRYYPGTTISPLTPALESTSRSSGGAAAGPAGAGAPSPAAASPAPPTLPATGIAVLLSSADSSELLPIHDLVLKSRDELAKTLGVTAPPRITLRFHDSQLDYEKASGQPWFTLGAATTGNEIQLMPMAMLRDRGLLERTIRRQLVHVLIDESLRRRPAWVREGAALFYADSSANPSSSSRGSCPTDLELMRPLSAGALASALADARSCFSRQIGDGRKWTDVR